MDLLLKLYNSRCSPPGLGEEERFRFLIKGEEGIPVHPFLIRAKTKVDLEKGEGRRRLIQVPVGVGKGVVEEFVKFLYLEQLDKDVGMKEELQLLRLGMLKELKLKREYQEKLVEMIDALKIEGQDTTRNFDNNRQERDGQCHSGEQDVPELDEGITGDFPADQGNGEFRYSGNDDDGDVSFLCVIKRERRQSPGPSSMFASTSRRSEGTKSTVSASVSPTKKSKPHRHLNKPSAEAQGGNEGHSSDAPVPRDVDRGQGRKERPKKLRKPKNQRGSYKCDTCGNTLSSLNGLDRHQLTVHLERDKYKCPQCEKTFSRSDHLRKHINSNVHRKRISS